MQSKLLGLAAFYILFKTINHGTSPKSRKFHTRKVFPASNNPSSLETRVSFPSLCTTGFVFHVYIVPQGSTFSTDAQSLANSKYALLT